MKRCVNLFGLVLVVVSIVLLTACEDADESVSSSQKMLNRPPYKGITDSINRSPKDPALYLQRALMLSQNNRHEIATADYQKSWELKSDPNTALEYISNLLTTDRVNEAVKLLEQGLKKISRQPGICKKA